MTILYFVAYSFCYMVSLLPFWVLYRISDLFYVLLYHIIKYKRKVVRNNLRISFPQKGENEILAIENSMLFCVTSLSKRSSYAPSQRKE